MWINGSYALQVVGHEIGHTLGLDRPGSYSCTNASGQRVAISTTCTANEYGDVFSIMGNSSTNHINIYQKGWAGWLEPNRDINPIHTLDVTSDGTYSLEPMEWATDGIQALRIPWSYDTDGSVLRYYYLEFRQPYGVFDNLSATAPVVNGVSLRIATPYNSAQFYFTADKKPLTPSPASLLIDATPSTSVFSDAALGVGKTFEDAARGITITTLSINKSVFPPVATIQVRFGSITCIQANPSVSLSPSRLDGYQGQTLTYSLTLTNNNTSVCSAAMFNVTPTLPTGWTQSPATLSLNAASGASVSQSLSVTSAPDAGFADNVFTETATNTADAKYASSAAATYYVLPPDTTPPTVTVAKPANGSTLKGNSVTIAASASDLSGISRLELFVDSASIKVCLNATSCQTRYSTSSLAKGSHTITATATDKAPTPNSASASITVTK